MRCADSDHTCVYVCSLLNSHRTARRNGLCVFRASRSPHRQLYAKLCAASECIFTIFIHLMKSVVALDLRRAHTQFHTLLQVSVHTRLECIGPALHSTACAINHHSACDRICQTLCGQTPIILAITMQSSRGNPARARRIILCRLCCL